MTRRIGYKVGGGVRSRDSTKRTDMWGGCSNRSWGSHQTDPDRFRGVREPGSRSFLTLKDGMDVHQTLPCAAGRIRFIKGSRWIAYQGFLKEKGNGQEKETHRILSMSIKGVRRERIKQQKERKMGHVNAIGKCVLN